MKLLKSIAIGLMSVAAAGVFSACEDDIKAPEFDVPVATLEANTTILDLKTEFWDDAQNYIKSIGTKSDGSHYVVKGRVITSDYAGNIFKSITIQDETAALTFSVNTYNLYLNYRLGQELLVDLTGLHIGKYNGLQQVGAPEWYEKGNAWEATFMAPQLFHSHVQLNGLPEPDKIVAHELASISDIPSGKEGLIKWQSQLVRLNNVTFVPQVNEADGQTLYTFGIYHENFNQKVNLAGQELTLRTSGYSNFFHEKMPTEPSDMTCLLSYYGSDWQLMLINYSDIENVGDPTLPAGEKGNPWTIDAAIEAINAGTAAAGWTQGYIVGTVAPEVVNVTSESDIEWGDQATLANTVVIALTPDTRDLGLCMVVPLPQDSKLREYVALRDHPENLGKVLAVYGTPGTVLGTYGIEGNNGTPSEFVLEGVEVPGGDEPVGPGSGDGTQEKPYSVSQAIALGNPGSTGWVKGFIVGWVDGASIKDGSHFEVPATSASNVLIADNAGETDYTKCMAVQLVFGDNVRPYVNLKDNPGNLGKELSVEGQLVAYFNQPGVKAPTAYTLAGEGGGDTPTPPVTGDGDGTEAKPYSVSQTIALGNPGTTGWIEGYIVGWVEGASISEGSHFEVPSTSASNVLIADNPDVKDYTKCVPVQLVYGDNVRPSVNLKDNPGNLGKKLTIEGTLTAYFGQPGLKTPTAYKLDGAGTGGGDTPTPPVTGTGDGTQANPYTVDQVKALGSPATTAWVTGVIVGCVDGKSLADGAKFEAVANVYSNILLAPEAGCTDVNKCIPVQLVSKTDIRAALNLGDNPGNLGKTVTLQGKLENYFGTPGVKSPDQWELK